MINKPLFWIVFNIVVFMAVYLYGRKWHPQLALALSLSSCIVMILLAYFDPSWILASLVLCLIYLGVLRMPNQQPGFRKLFSDYKIYPSKQALPVALAVLGEKKWHYSESFFTDSSGKIIPYFFWQGHIKYSVSSGEYVRKSTYSHYIAFIFPAETVSERFKLQVTVAADRSRNSVWQRIKFMFSPDTESPALVSRASDGTFIVEYYTLQESACYERRLRWMRERLSESRKLSGPAVVGLN